MTLVNIADAKARLSEFLEQAAEGREVVICRHNRPVARLVAVDPQPTAPTEPRPVGGASGLFHVPESFFEPLSPDVEALFYPSLERVDPVAKVAETPGT